ncbi:hypothetical protein OTK01_000327 [Caldicellulosiruptor acetigenus]|uniref:hypothetical protein n=1 Tax=Caldicellulosiruptor acetigenus TaxID=301953 RepID=UPI0022A99F6B|nr:hypothetical protein [Caldicellulosiruptor acetigenus]WAM36553.1 hypothetical protein OTK01_000327 [Caldicellulosiruptor acetigenus]
MGTRKQQLITLLVVETGFLVLCISILSLVNRIYTENFTLKSAQSLYMVSKAKEANASQLLGLIYEGKTMVFRDDTNSYIVFPVDSEGFRQPYRVQKKVIERLQSDKHVQKYLEKFKKTTELSNTSFYNAVDNEITSYLVVYDLIIVLIFAIVMIVAWGMITGTE